MGVNPDKTAFIVPSFSYKEVYQVYFHVGVCEIMCIRVNCDKLVNLNGCKKAKLTGQKMLETTSINKHRKGLGER